VSALATTAPSSVKKLSRKRWSWMRWRAITGIEHSSGEQFVDEAMPHGMPPARLARSAQGFGASRRASAGYGAAGTAAK